MSKMTSKMKYSYGFGALGKDLACAIVFTYLMFYLTDVVGLAPMFVGSLFLVARVWDAINDPMMGMIVDNTRSKWGKFRPWILIGTLINSVVLIFLFRRPNLEGTALYTYYSVAYILWGMTYTVMDIPYWSMLPSLSSNKEERDKIAVIPRIFASFAWLVVGSLGLGIMTTLGKGDMAKGFELFALIIAVIFIISAIVTVLNVKEQTITPPNEEKLTLKKAFNVIKRNDQLVAFIGVVLAYNMATQLTGGMALYYFKYVIGNEGLFSVFTGFSGVSEIAGLMLFPILSSRLDRNKVYGVGATSIISGFVVLLVVGIFMPQNAVAVGAAGIIFKLGSGFILGLSTVMLADVVDYSEFKFGERNESVVFSVQTLLVKFASAISGWLIGVALTLVGYVANVEQTAATILGMRILMTVIPIILVGLSYVVFKKYFKITGSYHEAMLEELEQKRKQKVA